MPDHDRHASLEAHPTIRSLVADVAGGGAAASVALSRMHDLLPAHFANEEAPGSVFDWVNGRAPELRSRVEALRAQHVDLSSRLRSLDLADPSEVEAFAAKLSAHEAEENEIVALAARRRPG